MNRWTRARCLLGSGILALAATNSVHAHEWLAECTIRFDNEFALRNLYAQARATFAYPTGMSPDGKPEHCNSSHTACWYYRERCGSRGYVNVDEHPGARYGHFHLGFEDPELDCFASTTDGYGSGFGRGERGGTCVAADWKREPRVAAMHDARHLARIWIDDRVTHLPRIFDVASIRVRGTVAAEVWFRKNDGSWWVWRSLAPGRWDLSAYANDIQGLYIRAVSGAPTSVSFDDIVVRN